MGKKLFYPIKNFSINKELYTKDLETIIEQTKIGHQLKINDIKPILINRYKRKYFQSFNKLFRITIDTDLSFYRIGKHSVSMVRKYHDDTNVILELKYFPDYDDDARQVSNNFPFRLTKSSKYVIGIENI